MKRFLSCVPCLLLGLAAWLAAPLCSFELWALFALITGLLLFWCLCRRPQLWVSLCYLWGCGALMGRETLLVLRDQVPCGLVTYGQTCAETSCVKKNYVLFIEAGCAKYECTRTERSETDSVFFLPRGTLHSAWLLTALPLCWAVLVLSARSLLRWSRERNLRVAQHTAVVLLLPCTYCVCAVSALRAITANHEDFWAAEAMLDVAELFSSVALYAFQRLLVIYVDGCETDGSLKLQLSLQSVMSLGIKQYVVLAFGCNLLLVAVKAWDGLQPASCGMALDFIAHSGFPHHNISLAVNEQKLNLHTRASSVACEDVWNATSFLMVAADFFTCSIALFAVLQYERAFSVQLLPLKPIWKFWGVKGLLSVNFLQSSVLRLVSWIFASTGFVATLLNYHLLCVESFLLASLNLWAYAVEEEELPDESELCPAAEAIFEPSAIG